ncbi:MAG TPA: F0F1 ATP synthase subunit delta [Symbiobacteriaceae bacterium]|jgi:F-type H+-transporting ATPase subunit delta
MLNQAVARRYARALFDLAQEKGLVDQVDRELGMVVSMIASNPQLHAVMADVLIAPEVKRGLVQKLFTGKLSPLVMNFLLLVVHKRREGYLAGMYRVYLDMANELRGVVEVEVRSAVALEDSIIQNLNTKLTARLGKRVQFQTQVAPELIGGLVVRVGDTLMDGSVKTRLHRMRERLIRSKAE